MSLITTALHRICCRLGKKSTTMILDNLLQKLERNYWQYQPTTEDLEDAAKVAFRMASAYHLHLVVDGLDECEELNAVLEWLTNSWKVGGKVLWFLTSRPDPTIEASMKPCARFLAADLTGISHDIRLFLQQQIRNEPLLKDVSSASKSKIEETVLLRSDGVLYASSRFQSLCY